VTIHLPDELEQLIRQDIQHGPYRSVDEFLEHAVRLLHEHEDWLAFHREKFTKMIDEGWQAAARGELADETVVRARMEERKRAWLEQKRQA
jgi:putative addiction module CopG family antidote